jgi:hypothetical protein
VAWSTPLASSTRSFTISRSQIFENGSSRVLHVLGFLVSDGNDPRCHFLADRVLMPAAAAAVSCFLPSICFCLSNLTCSSVTIEIPLGSEGLTRRQDGRDDRQK